MRCVHPFIYLSVPYLPIVVVVTVSAERKSCTAIVKCWVCCQPVVQPAAEDTALHRFAQRNIVGDMLCCATCAPMSSCFRFL